MYLPLPTPTETTAWDRTAIDEFGIPGFALMETASREAVAVLLDEYGAVEDLEILCVAGGGNNGGDAFAMARHLTDLGADVTVAHTKAQSSYRGETKAHMRLARKVGVHFKRISSAKILRDMRPDILVDGLLGTGFQGELRDDAQELIKAMNRIGEHAFVLSIDVPSGLNAQTGLPQPAAVQADATATFEAAKLGLALEGASRYTGGLHVCPIGIPRHVLTEAPPDHWLISADVMDLVPFPRANMHKGAAGHVLIVGGSSGMTGAPHLAALGALRAGAGLVTAACPADLADAVKLGRADVMTLPLGEGAAWRESMVDQLQEEMDRFDAVVVGPGMGKAAKTVDFIRSFVAQCLAPLIIDADALNALAPDGDAVGRLPETTIATPHPGEMGRLLNVSAAEVQADRLEAAKTLLKGFAGTLVLKGARTIVAQRGRTCISPLVAPNLAVAGSGDVLSGVVAALAAAQTPIFDAACAAVYWHGAAGVMLAEEFPARGNLATDIANTLPIAAKEHMQC